MRRIFPGWHPSSIPPPTPQLNIPAQKPRTHAHRHTPCIVFSSAQLLMDKQRAVNCDGLSADIFPSHILEAQETHTRAGTVKREEKLKVKLTHCLGCSHTNTRTHALAQACTHNQMCMHVFTEQIQTNRRSARSLKMSGGAGCVCAENKNLCVSQKEVEQIAHFLYWDG